MINFRSLLDWVSGRIRPSDPVKPLPERERRRYQRIATTEGSAFFGEHGPFPISNLSYGGTRIQVGQDPIRHSLEPGTTRDVRLLFASLQFVTSLQICSISPDGEIGCSFTRITPAQGRMLSDYIKPRIIGSSFQEINAASLQIKDEHLRLRWFQGEHGAQIFLWQTVEGDMVKEEYYFLDYVITLQHGDQSLRTGRIQDGPGRSGFDGFGRIDPNRIAFFNVPSFRALRMGKTILEFSSLPPEAKDHLLAGIAREERRLYHRYCLHSQDTQVRFYHTFHPDSPFPVANLSFNGIALLMPEHFPSDTIAQQQDLTGELAIGINRFPAGIRVVYGNRQLVGGTLTLGSEESKEALAEFLAPRLLGQSLEEVPAPSELPASVPVQTRAYLFVGMHNTHILTLMAPGGRMVIGRIVFMDRVLAFDGKKLTELQCPRGIVFPHDWELPLELVDEMPEVSADLVVTCRMMLGVAPLPTEVREGWSRVLPTFKEE